jgi:hypothetical protein
MLDLFCGRWGWSKSFALRGWHCIGLDLVRPPEIPFANCEFICEDILNVDARWVNNDRFDFICASPPCQQFSVHGMKHFHPNPPYPKLGIQLFEYTRRICEESGVPYVIENVRAAQQFVGNAVHHCGPFYLWGTGVPPLVSRGVKKGIDWGSSKAVNAMATQEEKRKYRDKPYYHNRAFSMSLKRHEDQARVATIPPELSNAVADYAKRLLEQRAVSTAS